jgi:saccharopine dehydrogenase (NADP+, L-glutamate forming)
MSNNGTNGKILVLGAGRVARPCVSYLVQKGYSVTIADISSENLDTIARGVNSGDLRTILMSPTEDFKPIIGEIRPELVVCLLPPRLSAPCIEACVEFGAHMIHPSYVDGEQKKFEDRIKQSGRVIIAELGLDPGIDHMSAVKNIADAARDGFTVESYKSACGALPSLEANTNPWGYKLSWAPASLIGTMRRSAKGLSGGQPYDFPDGEAFKHIELLDVAGLSTFELYANGDATPYRELYSIPEVKTIYRGTLRYPGWSETVAALNAIGLTGTEKTDTKNCSFAQFTANRMGVPVKDVRDGFCKKTGAAKNSALFLRMEWLGFFGDETIPFDSASGMDVIALLFDKKLQFKPEERDMIVLVDEMIMVNKKTGARRKQVSKLIDFGTPGGDSSIARTTGLPPAIAAHLIMSGEIKTPGLHIPVTEEIYAPVLRELAKAGIKLEEEITDL